jgi:hypothetical protein
MSDAGVSTSRRRTCRVGGDAFEHASRSVEITCEPKRTPAIDKHILRGLRRKERFGGILHGFTYPTRLTARASD